LNGREPVALIASYSRTSEITPSLATYAAECCAAGFVTAIVRVSDAAAASDWPSTPPPGVTVFRRANHGYDFGSWAAMMRAFPQVLHAPTVLLTNDSMAGPFAPIGKILEQALNSTADVWGAVRSEQFMSHLQSYMVAFNRGVLAEPVLRGFWENLPPVTAKAEIIERLELGLSTLLWAEGFSTEAFIEGRAIAAHGQNPAISAWHAVLDSGFPFVKRQLLREPHLVQDGDQVAKVVALLFATNPYDWVADVDQARNP
jgi:lipopolysaccharide biosynthesis protein